MGIYLGNQAEIAVKIGSIIEDSLGKWAQVILLGTNHEPLRQWRLQHNDPLFISNQEVLERDQLMNPELFYSREVRVLPGDLAWGRNMVEERPGTRLPGIDRLAQDLGFGGGVKVGDQEGDPGEGVGRNPVKKKLKGPARVAAMLKKSRWSWKESTLDPAFKRPKIKLRRKKDQSSSSSSSQSQEKDVRSEESEGEDLYPEEHQTKYIARKCPGLLFRHGIKQAKSQVLTLQGEAGGSRDPERVFVRYHRQVFMSQSSSPPLRREHLTLSNAVDLMIKGEILKAGDVLVQRLKALEQIAQGAPAHLAMKLEVVAAEQVSMVSQEEARTAASEHARELKLQQTWKGKGKSQFTPSSPSWGIGSGKGKQEKGGKGRFQKGDRTDKGQKGEQVQKSAVVIPT